MLRSSAVVWDSELSMICIMCSLQQCVQDCNFVGYDGSYTTSNGYADAANAFFATNTYGGTSPCSFTVSSANGGSISVVDATGRTLYSKPTAASLPPVDTLAAGQKLAQGDRLYCANGSYFVTMQADGNLVLCASCTLPCIVAVL